MIRNEMSDEERERDSVMDHLGFATVSNQLDADKSYWQ